MVCGLRSFGRARRAPQDDSVSVVLMERMTENNFDAIATVTLLRGGSVEILPSAKGALVRMT